MAYIVGTDKYQSKMITSFLDDLIDTDNSVRVIDAYVNSLDLSELGIAEQIKGKLHIADQIY